MIVPMWLELYHHGAVLAQGGPSGPYGPHGLESFSSDGLIEAQQRAADGGVSGKLRGCDP
jgi:hypothetical protein